MNRRVALGFSVFIAAIALAQVEPKSVSINAPYVTTPPQVVETMLKIAGVAPGDVVYDLGCGDGRIAIAAAKRQARGVGVDLNPERIREARAGARRAGVVCLTEFREQDVFDADLREATVVTLYLLPQLNLDLRPKLQRELRPGARVVSHCFDMGDWKPDKQTDVGGCKIYEWVIR